MAELGVVNNAVRSIQTVEEYIKVGMDICNEVALDFLENKNEGSDNDVVEYRQIMLKFAKMEREIKQVQEAVDFVKQQPHDSEQSLEEIFDHHLKDVRKGDKDEMLLQHDKVQNFNQRMWEALHPEEAISASEFGFPPSAAGGDDDVEMTQEQVNTKCPYTGAEMVNPVRNKLCGHNYEKDAITTYMKQKKNKAKCPLSGCSNEMPVQLSHLEENKELKRYIERLNRDAKKRPKK